MTPNFDIPVCLIIFKRKDTTLRIIQRLSEVKPQKVYLIADQGRDEAEREMVFDCREAVEQAITWDCDVVKYYADENRGVYENIAGGAKWVFEREKSAIFLEDDNLPAVSFFQYCKEMLEKYENDDDVVWVCGTNYLEKYPSDSSYMFTSHMLPCGWASWATKFVKTYDGELVGMKDPDVKKKLRKCYRSRTLYKQQLYCFRREMNRKKAGKKYRSWDYQMAFSLRYNHKLGISPALNQIENIGVDELSTHGGTSFEKTMTRRYCGIPTHELSFPLNHPQSITIDEEYEKRIDKIVTNPWSTRVKHDLKCMLLRLMKIDDTLPYSEAKKEISKKLKHPGEK